MDWIDKIIEAVSKLGALTPSAIFALVAVAFGYRDYRKERFAEESNEKWRLTREGTIRAEEAQTAVLEKNAEVTAMNTDAIKAQTARIDYLSTILEERLPRRV